MKISVPEEQRRPPGLILALALVLFLAGGCSSRPATLADATDLPSGYQRRIMVVLERSDFRPIPRARITIDVEAPTRLVSPAEGQGVTNSQGGLELVFEPLPHYDEAAAVGGDVVVDFSVKAKLTVERTNRPTVAFDLTDQETYARYAGSLYQGLNRDPEAEITYYNVVLP